MSSSCRALSPILGGRSGVDGLEHGVGRVLRGGQRASLQLAIMSRSGWEYLAEKPAQSVAKPDFAGRAALIDQDAGQRIA